MLFHEYADPFAFLDGISAMGMFEQGILNLVEKDNDRHLWDVYLRCHSDLSFNDWKIEIMKPKKVEMTQTEIAKEVENAENILKTFHLERG